MNIQRLEELAKSKDYNDLRWLTPVSAKFEEGNSRYVLYGKPKDYKGKYADYTEPIIAEIRNSNYTETIGYCWVERESSFGVVIGDWIIE